MINDDKTLYVNGWAMYNSGAWLGILTNGNVRNDGQAVMGAGQALQAKHRLPQLPQKLGSKLLTTGNHVYMFPQERIFTFPTKNSWMDKADLKLIERSVHEFIKFIEPGRIYCMPRPGIGLGQLSWDEVKPIMGPLMEIENFFFVELPEKRPE